MSNELTEETVTDFTDAPVVPEAETETGAAEAIDTEAGEASEEGATTKGRPRDEATIQRDDAVLAAIAEGPITRDQLATKLEIKGNLVYLSLWRLRNAGKVIKLNGKTWALPGTELPEPEAKTAAAPVAEEVTADS